MKIIEKNKKAYFDYFLEETLEAGISLKGSEVKSIKLGNVSLRDCFCHIENGEIILKNCHIAPYKKGSFYNEDPLRDRRLLLHRREIDRLAGKVREKGYTLVPTQMYFNGNRVKMEIALAKGKHLFDKKQTLKEKDILREAEREIRKYN